MQMMQGQAQPGQQNLRNRAPGPYNQTQSQPDFMTMAAHADYRRFQQFGYTPAQPVAQITEA